MTERLPARSWAPAREAPVLLTVQLIALWTATLRGLDYLNGSDRPALDTAAASTTAGLGLLLGGLLVLIGVAGRWASSVIVGHALVGVWYLGLGGLALRTTATLDPVGGAGIVLSVAGVALLVHRSARTWARLAVAVPLMIVGQVVLAHALGADYRQGTGLIGAGCLHLALSAGTAHLWQRRRLAEVVDREAVHA